MYGIQQFRHLLDFVHDHQSAGRLGEQSFPERVRISFERPADRIDQEVIVNGIRETLLQKRGFSYLSRSEKEHSLVQLVLNVEDAELIRYKNKKSAGTFPQISVKVAELYPQYR